MQWTGNSAGAVVGGYEANGTKLCVCRADYRGGLHAGKVVGDSTCNYGYGGREEKSTTFESLNTYPPVRARASCR